MTRQWAQARIKELFENSDLDSVIERTDLIGALSRIERTSSEAVRTMAFQRIRDWMNYREELLENRKSQPKLLAYYIKLNR